MQNIIDLSISKDNNFEHKRRESLKSRKTSEKLSTDILSMSDILSLLNFNISYIERMTEIDNYLKKDTVNYKKLVLSIVATTLNMDKIDLIITPKGLINSKRNVSDGIVLFGNKNNNNNIDFVFPVDEIDDEGFPNFAIFYNIKDESYYIKDFSTGLGALMKISKYQIKENTLVNVGNNYLVISYESPNLIIKVFNSEILKEQNTAVKNYETKIFNIQNNKNNHISIGRSKKCDITIDDLMLSKIQCLVTFEQNNPENPNLFLVDGDMKKESTNGTWIYILNSIKIIDNFTFKAEHTLFTAKFSDN